MDSFESFVMGIFTNEAFVSVLTFEDRKKIVEYYVNKLREAKNAGTLDDKFTTFVTDLLDQYDMKKHPFSLLKRGIIGGQVSKSLGNAVDKIEINKDNAAFMELIFSLDFFKDKRLDPVREKISMFIGEKHE